LAILAIIYGIISELRIFRGASAGKINKLLTIIIALIAARSGFAVFLIEWAFRISGWFAILGFSALLIGGIVLWSIARGIHIWGTYEPRTEYERVRSIQEDIKRLSKELKSATDELDDLEKKQREGKSVDENKISKLRDDIIPKLKSQLRDAREQLHGPA